MPTHIQHEHTYILHLHVHIVTGYPHQDVQLSILFKESLLFLQNERKANHHLIFTQEQLPFTVMYLSLNNCPILNEM